MEFTVKIGKYKINGIAEHWAIKVGSSWYEVQGSSKQQSGSRNVINKHNDDSKYSTIETYGPVTCDTEEDLEDFMNDWNNKWVQEHPIYAYNGDNCQLYVKHLILEFFGETINTQNYEIGSVILGTSIGAGLVALCGVAVGLMVKGSH